jgi:hypothetical protein
MVGSHGVHAPPAVPHADADGVVHAFAAQQPFWQELASQTQLPATQR